MQSQQSSRKGSQDSQFALSLRPSWATEGEPVAWGAREFIQQFKSMVYFSKGPRFYSQYPHGC